MEILRWNKIAGREAFHAARDARVANRPLPYHDHDFAEIFWIDAGRGVHHVNGARVPLSPGDLVFMRPADCHGIEQIHSEGIKLTNIAFPAETLTFLAGRYFSRRRWEFEAGKYPVTRRIEPSQQHRFNHWADELAQAPRERVYIERFLLNVLTDLHAGKNSVETEGCPDWLVQACQAIHEPVHFSGGVATFLHLCGRSREHVARSVRRHLGLTPTDYVNRVRIAYAQRQLAMSNQSILEIALDCGMENLSHFYELFRARTGATPRAYRLAQRKLL